MESQAMIKDKPTFQGLTNNVSLYISKSHASSRINKTGSWRFARPVYENKTAPCSASCPAGNYIPKVVMHLSKENIHGAFRALIQENPFPATCGRVCFHTCESACNRGSQDQAVAFRCLERYIGDMAITENFPLDAKSLAAGNAGNIKVAILGAGPAGLSAAFFLTRLGFSCEIFESTDKAGGVMQWGIPSHRLPKSVLDHEIQRIVNMGIKIHYNHSLDAEFMTTAHHSFGAMFISPGLSVPLTMGIEGESHIHQGLQLLMDIQTKDMPLKQGRVAVIGGGNTAIDVARSLKRLGADPVIVYRRRKQDMPAFAQEIVDTEKEGIEIIELKSPVAVQKIDKGFILNLVSMAPVTEKGNDGRTRVMPVDNTPETMIFSEIYSGIGATLHDSWKADADAPESAIKLDHVDFHLKDIPFLYGGDCVNDVQSVTHAIASGKEAAIALSAYVDSGIDSVKKTVDICRLGAGKALSMEIYLQGERRLNSDHVVTDTEINLDYFTSTPRIEPGHIPLKTSVTSFKEVEKTFTREAAMAEALRCYQCGFCNECENCRIFCPEISITRQNGKKMIDLDYCKGCGVCSVECPRNAITMEEEK
ncbi:NADPH-dependent glutamate synthase beta chain [Desulfocicer vacuolatum DSM 3385]|uniref:NADPH-dependent glutamate synthase beta chain n=1 Tax=Desulfocicer vacuolatum DSM 3385 TaxID=1121400 RepID=A0A1W2AHJ6_9BACT|nr:FAD-dependent oxidoreductase [Desulfocicer vacuolatum]SMC60175.1 NADPH-dependent glutamate synthase beta chain [Desulfocicer vacuolatum DSM 3385]